MAELHDIKDRSPNPDLIAMLERNLAVAKAGDLRSVVMVLGWGDDTVSNGWSVDPRSNRRMMLAEMAMCQADFIVKISVEDGHTVLSHELRGY